MTISIALPILLLVVFLIWLVLSIVRNEASATKFWWELLVGLAILGTFGASHLG
jgi:uncharacterized membrane protein YhaH (DUF805 family)